MNRFDSKVALYRNCYKCGSLLKKSGIKSAFYKEGDEVKVGLICNGCYDVGVENGEIPLRLDEVKE